MRSIVIHTLHVGAKLVEISIDKKNNASKPLKYLNWQRFDPWWILVRSKYLVDTIPSITVSMHGTLADYCLWKPGPISLLFIDKTNAKWLLNQHNCSSGKTDIYQQASSPWLQGGFGGLGAKEWSALKTAVSLTYTHKDRFTCSTANTNTEGTRRSTSSPNN